MSNRYSLTFNLSTDEITAAIEAVSDVARMIDEKCIVERREERRIGSRPVFVGKVVYTAASDAEADDLAERAKRLPGLPPMDAVEWRLVKRDA